MVFSGVTFLAYFLPCVLLVYAVAPARLRNAVLLVASLVFYTWGSGALVGILFVSIVVDYGLGFLAALAVTTHDDSLKRRAIALSVTVNLALLGWFKYAGWFISEASDLGLWTGALPEITLPIGISFFTFQQVAYLIDVYRQESFEHTLAKYSLFVCFFPQLIAGPIVHHREMMPQFGKQRRKDVAGDVAVGLTIFAIGLFKKVVIADTVAIQSSRMFDGAAQGLAPTLIDAWAGTFFYAFQIYFDFSGYSDMAIGLGRLFGIRLPMNFASPYKATSIIDFWRRWHITLSRFLRDYLYIPLGGNRRGPAHRYVNVFVTMLLGGIWHGAGWTFFLWGTLHGLFIVVNQFWREYIKRNRASTEPIGRWQTLGWRSLTLMLVLIAWVPFRADGLDVTLSIYAGMLGLNGISLPAATAPLLTLLPEFFTAGGIDTTGIQLSSSKIMLGIPFLLLVVWYTPNTEEIMRKSGPSLATTGYPATQLERLATTRLIWNGGRGSAVVTAILFTICLLKLNDISEFIYFQF